MNCLQKPTFHLLSVEITSCLNQNNEKGENLVPLMDILWTAEEDNSLIVADEKLSPFNTSYSTESCSRAFAKGKMK